MKKFAVVIFFAAMSAIAQQTNAPFKTRSMSSGVVNTTINPSGGVAPWTADPSGASDATAIIQLALDTAYANRSATVELSAGTYKIGASGNPLFMRPGVTLKGPGTGTATLAPVNGRSAAITSWSCAAATGTCTSGTAPYTLTLNLATPVFNGLQNVDSFCNPSGGTCQLFTYFGFAANHGFYAMYGGALTGVFVGENRPTLPLTNWWLATSFTLPVATPPTANSGTGGTFFIPINPIQFYDARNGTAGNATGATIRDLTIDLGCNLCDTRTGTYFDTALSIQARQVPGNPTILTNYTLQNVNVKNSPVTSIRFAANDGVVMTDIDCDTVGEACIGGQDISNLLIDGVTARNMGFPFHSDGLTNGYTSSLFNDLLTSATYNVTLRNLTFIPRNQLNLNPFAISGFSNGANPDTSHRLVHDWLIDNLYMRDPCLPDGGMVTVFVDNLKVAHLDNDHSNCSLTTPPHNSSGFIEIGGSNNHVTSSQDVHVTWAGITNDFTHAHNIEVDHIQWHGYFVTAGVVNISGAQAGVAPAGCTIDGIDFHDNQATFQLSAGNTNANFIGVGYGEGEANCTTTHVNVHDNIARADPSGLPSTSAAFMLLGHGNGSTVNSDWSFHNNRIEGFANYFWANCSNDIGVANKYGTQVNNLRVESDFSDLAPASLVLDKTTLPGCPANWTGVSTWLNNTWAGVDYNLARPGVTGTITGVASSCVTGTATSAMFKQHAFVSATRSDGALPQDGNTVQAAALADGTATVKVCSGTTPEPAGTYNVLVTNPQF